MKSVDACATALLTLLLAPVPAKAHGPDEATHQFARLGDLRLEDGGVIENLRMSYVTHGRLNAARDNAILVMHGLGGNHHAADHLIGPGRPLDTDRYFIICADELGNTQTTFEHSTSPTSSGLKMKFLQYKGRDQVAAEHRLVTQALGIRRLLAVVGFSAGAHRSIQMAVSYPGFVDAMVLISGGALWTTQALGYVSMVESILETCPGWNGGDYEANPKKCAATAMLVFAPNFYTRDWWERNVRTPAAHDKWREAWGARLFDVQDARDLYYRQRAESLGWVGDTPGFDGDLNAALRSIQAKTLFLANPRDRFVPRQYYEAQVRAIPDARVVWIESEAGHMVCCDADPEATRILGAALGSFLEELGAQRRAGR